MLLIVCELCEGESYFVLITEDGFEPKHVLDKKKKFIKLNFFVFYIFEF